MKAGLGVVIALLLWVAPPASAHRLDEFLQATTIAVDKNQVTAQMRLTPGVAVFRTVLSEIDADGDGIFSEAEQRAYAERVLHDLSLRVDDKVLQLQVVVFAFPSVEEMKAGRGEIQLTLRADVPPGGQNRRLVFENHYQSKVAAYLVNILSPADPDIRVIAQDRNFDQSFYQVDYIQARGSNLTPAPSPPGPIARGTDVQPSRETLSAAYFLHGVHHILTGCDHLLFVSALVLAATTLWELVKVVSAFTFAHTITLTLAALNLVHLPAKVVEPLISASIVCVALQNVYWPDRSRGWVRLGTAFFFGLFHGLGFAGGLLETMRELPGAALLLAILAFSFGVEVGHQAVILPLFALLNAARQTPWNAALSTSVSMLVQRIGSVGISAAGMYYLFVALTRLS